MKDLKNLDKWMPWAASKLLSLPSTKERRVKLYVNAAEPVRIDLVPESTRKRFLARVDGLEVISFVVSGPCLLITDGDCEVYTAELEQVHVVVPDAVSFTKIATRRARNPELEQIMHRMAINMERRLAVAQRDLEARFAAQAATKEGTDDDNTGAPAGATGQQKPKPDKGGKKPAAPKGAKAGPGGDAGDGAGDDTDQDEPRLIE